MKSCRVKIDELPPDRSRSTLQKTIAAERDAAIAHWIGQMPLASTVRIAGFAGTSETAVSKWRKAHSH